MKAQEMYENYARKMAEQFKEDIETVKEWGIVKYYKECVDKEYGNDNTRKEGLLETIQDVSSEDKSIRN